MDMPFLVQGDEFLTLHGTQQLYVDAFTKKRCRFFMKDEWVVLCQALYQSSREEDWNEMHETLEEISKDSCGKERKPDSGWIAKAGLERGSERRFLLCQRGASSSL